MALATENWSEHRYTPGVSAERGMVVTGAANVIEAIAACGTLQASEGASYIRDRDLEAGPPEVSQLGPVIYHVAWTYTATELKPPEDENGGVDRRPVFDWQPDVDQKPAERDAKKQPFVNSVGDLFDQPFFKPEPFLRLGFTRWESNYDPQLHINFAGKKNTSAVSIRTLTGEIGLEAGQLLCLSIAPAQSYRSTATAVPVTYSFEMRKTFKRRVLNVGTNAWFRYGSQPIALGRICNALGEPIAGSVRLDKEGKPINKTLKVLVKVPSRTTAAVVAAPNQNLPPLKFSDDSTADAVWIEFDMYEDANFAALGL